VNRSYSLCSSPFEDEDLTVAVKTVEGGKASVFLNQELQAGTSIEVMEPMGNFTIQAGQNAPHDYVFFAGGSGITPIMSMIRSIRLKEPNSTITLIYGNRDTKSIIFKAALEKLESESNGKFKIVHILNGEELGWNGYTGLLTKEIALQLIRENTNLSFSNTDFYMCGPSPMMASVTEALGALAIPESRIHKEYFTAKEDSEKQEGSVGEASDAPISGNTMVKIIYDGDEVEFEMNVEDNVLEAALDAGHDPPYSCMVAACCTCRARLKSGSVRMDDRESLTDEEIEEGYVLTCQAHPTSHGVVLDYDD
jgi:ring-1,2-phenylacetyl-CoA epoxidase subunit PaaE